jgi:hypothetical protein
MGRYYSGDIEGKFWFGTQDSTDASNFGVDPLVQYDYQGCQCCATDDVDDCQTEEELTALYCSSCYDSMEDHLEKTEEDRQGSDKTYYEGNEVYYHFQESHLDTLKKALGKLEKKVGKYMAHFVIVDKTADFGGVQYEYHLPEGVTLKKGEQELLARLCLGRQILFCVEKYGSCGFHAEL